MVYIESSKIKVFPSDRRNDEIDRNARLFNEQNITGIVKGITNKNFVISGLNITNNILQAGECSIGGYYFNITSSQSLTAPSNDLKYVYLRASTTPLKVDSSNIIFNELIGLTYTNSTDTIDEYNLNTLDNSNYFEGLNLIYTGNELQDITYENISDSSNNKTYAVTHYNLLLGEYDTTLTQWVTNLNNQIKYTEEDAYLDDGVLTFIDSEFKFN